MNPAPKGAVGTTCAPDDGGAAPAEGREAGIPNEDEFFSRSWWVWLSAILVVGLALRLVGLHDPLMDHPAWRQGDTAAIARNFAQLNFNIFYPQTDYDGPPPNYVQLELQIVPYLAAIGYKLFGVHEVFGRLISIGFSLGTVAVLGFFGRWLFDSALAGLLTALLYAIFPGSVYYGRTFMPDTAMAFFLTAAVFASVRTLLAAPPGGVAWREMGCAVMLAVAFLAKPVAVVAVLPLLAVDYLRPPRERRAAWLRSRGLQMIVPALVSVWIYLAYVGAHAEWHWASGITERHVLPALARAFASPRAMAIKLETLLTTVTGMLSTTMLGPVGFGLALLGFLVPPRSRSKALLYGWLIAIALYAFVVVTVERVDYYLYPALPLAALAGAGFGVRLWAAWAPRGRSKTLAAVCAALALIVVVGDNMAQVAPYYYYKRGVYLEARHLSRLLQPGTLVVMGHYDPSILYYMQHKGWEEDPYLWTPLDEQSAIRKGARYYIDVEHNRFRRNAELYAWMQRFPLVPGSGMWPVYETDYAKVLPGAEQRWREFRARERTGKSETSP
jgi:4-amino-4-deoxy-L-arabinose transferase-like glycosyltransferase